MTSGTEAGAVTAIPTPDADRGITVVETPPNGGFSGRVARGLRRLQASIPAALVMSDLVVLAVVAEAEAVWVVLVVSFIAMASSGGYYRSRLSLLWLDEAPGLLGRFLAAGFIALAAAEFRGWTEPSWSRLLIAIALLLTARAFVYAAIRSARSRRLVNHRTLIVGSGRMGHDLAHILHEHPEFGLRPVGFYDPEPLQLTSLPVIADDLDLDQAVNATDARVVILAFSRIPEVDLVHMLRASVRLHAEVFYVPRLHELHSLDIRDVEDAWGIPLIRLRRQAVRSASWRIKRLIDVVVSTALLLLTAPVMLLIAALVRIRLGPPVLFRQVRVSVDDSEFMIAKFRTLPDSEPAAGDIEWTSAAREPEALGRFLRATSLDELPQLANVLRGDMSLVGPRPERTHFARQFAEADNTYGQRHRVRTGLTGLAQIKGLRGDTSIEDRARFDNAYIERWSLASDLKILLRTPLAAVRWRGK